MKKEFGPSQSQEMIRGLVNAAREVQRKESTRKSTGDIVIDALIKMGKPLTVQNYFEMNWAAVDGIEKIEDLDAENLAEVQRLVERSVLVDTKSERVN